LSAGGALYEYIRRALEAAPKAFPTKSTVACQGVEGAYSQQACDRMFEFPSILYFSGFEGVFQAVEKGMCRYGVLPIENSTAGSVSDVYRLMERHHFHIVRGIRQRIDHALLANPGATPGGIAEVLSHPQGIAQCSAFLAAHPNIKVTPVENTAVAAKTVAQSKRTDLAAIASRSCAELYALKPIVDAVADSDNNYTRFIVIGKELEIFPGANKISMTLSLPHEPGALHGLISRFASLGINLTKLESLPIPGREFEFRFHFDIEASLTSPDVVSLLCEIEQNSENFVLLGNYPEGY
jgi:chorismate mutase/prephenate dehydratase